MRDPTGHSDLAAFVPQSPRGLVAVVGSRNVVSERIEIALRDRFAFEFVDTSSPPAPGSNVTAPRPSLYVVNCYRAFNAAAATPATTARARRAITESLDEWIAEWTQRIAELQRHDPTVPIVVTLNEQHDSAMVSRAVAAGADEVIGAAVADVPQLVRQRVRSLLLDTDPALAESLWDTGAPAATMATSPLAVSTASWPAVQGRTAPDRRDDTGRRHQDHARDAGTTTQHWMPRVARGAAEAALQRVRDAIPSLPTVEQRSAPLADLMQVRMPSLRAPSGRLDAGRIAARIGVSLSRLAGPLRVSRQALSEMPDSPKAQSGLDPFARVLAVLEELLPNEKAARAWLVSPQQRFSGATPQAVMLDGRAEEVARTLELARDGGLGA